MAHGTENPGPGEQIVRAIVLAIAGLALTACSGTYREGAGTRVVGLVNTWIPDPVAADEVGGRGVSVTTLGFSGLWLPESKGVSLGYSQIERLSLKNNSAIFRVKGPGRMVCRMVPDQ